MEKVILLKTQLAEAARFGKSKEFRYQRLAGIFLDNFVEIQLNSIAKQKFLLDTELSKFQEKKYTEKYRRRVLNHYDELLKFAVSEGIINEQEKYLLAFCHDVRNNLYHSIKEEKLFVAISIKVLKDIITKKQPHWKNTSRFTAHTGTIIDPYKYKNLMSNSPEDWTKFLNQYFDFIDKRTLKPSNLLRKFILEKMRAARNNYKFLKNEFADYFPYAENWGFNEYIYYYYFKTLHAEKLREINEIEDKKEKDNSRKSLEEEYKNTWKKKKLSRIEAIEKKAKSMSNSDISKSLEIYTSLRDEINLISQGLENAASDLYAQIDLEAEMANGN
ncbi:hypothetical protein [Chryseobacterium sp. EZn1]|uniref:hypothetical protein n=1 Tax=Chryseobacterium cupriresistens TaxID=3366770 RepID=UPI0039852A6F